MNASNPVFHNQQRLMTIRFSPMAIIIQELMVSAILKYKGSVRDIEHSLFIDIANLILYIYMYL